jgi:predicted HAD superfamily Cof-like phosphohydrolase
MQTEELHLAYSYDPRDPYYKVREFHETYGQPVAYEPQFLSEARMELRKKLIEEEYQEFLDAVEEGDLMNAFKELADLIYVVEGTAVEMGGNLSRVFSEVHRSNMSKLDADGEPIYREDGKVLKGPNYFEPDIESVV